MKVYIEKPVFPYGGVAKIYLIEDKGIERYSIHIDKESEFLIQKKINEAESVEPFLSIPQNIFEDLVKGISDFALNNGIKSENESLLQGKFTATEKHLEDMRKIVFKSYNKNENKS